MSCRRTRANAASPWTYYRRRAPRERDDSHCSRRLVGRRLPARRPRAADQQQRLPVTETLPNAKRWSDPATWPDQKVPTAGADVVIAKETDVLLDVSPPALSSIRIEGTLTADDRDLELTAGNVLCTDR